MVTQQNQVLLTLGFGGLSSRHLFMGVFLNTKEKGKRKMEKVVDSYNAAVGSVIANLFIWRTLVIVCDVLIV